LEVLTAVRDPCSLTGALSAVTGAGSLDGGVDEFEVGSPAREHIAVAVATGQALYRREKI
jgi:hypothetical protein